MKILTTKSPEELLRENQRLQTQLQALLAVAAQSGSSHRCSFLASDADVMAVAEQMNSQSLTSSNHQHSRMLALPESAGAKDVGARGGQTAASFTSKTAGGSTTGESGESGQVADLEAQTSTDNVSVRRRHSQSRSQSQCSENEYSTCTEALVLEGSAAHEAESGEQIPKRSISDTEDAESDEDFRNYEGSSSEESSRWSREE
uniref:Uncharacterized protein n=1 Tax=Craspedostauros australis TaxID=1486917 RepID=A0A7R9ZPE3_9STRA